MQFQRQRLREHPHTALGTGVSRKPWRRTIALAGADHDDLAGAALAQMRDGGMCRVVGTGQVDVDRLAPRLGVAVFDPTLLGGDTGIGHHNIDSTVFFAGAPE
ncbi:hypothetical protein D3C75_1065860 [compost metagenome]